RQPDFIGGFQKTRFICEWPVFHHLRSPFFGAATVEQDSDGSLAWQAVESLQRFGAVRCDFRASEQAQAADATVGINLKTHMRGHICMGKFAEHVATI